MRSEEEGEREKKYQKRESSFICSLWFNMYRPHTLTNTYIVLYTNTKEDR